MKAIEFFVPGTPRPAGSKIPQPIYRHGKPVLTATGRVVAVARDTSGEKGNTWRGDVRDAAGEVKPAELLDCPIALFATFHIVRPKAHYGTGRNAGELKADAPFYPLKDPDTTKLLRALEDALNGYLWKDDNRVVVQVAQKVFSIQPGVMVRIVPLRPADWGKVGTLFLWEAGQ